VPCIVQLVVLTNDSDWRPGGPELKVDAREEPAASITGVLLCVLATASLERKPVVAV
jgi:hypothetical protein